MSELESPGRKVLRDESPRIDLKISEEESASTPQLLPVAEAVPYVEDEDVDPVAGAPMPRLKYYGWRVQRLLGDLCFGLVVFSGVKIWCEASGKNLAPWLYLVFCLSFALAHIVRIYFGDALVRSLGLPERVKYRIADLDGNPVSDKVLNIRIIAYAITWLLLPLNLVLIPINLLIMVAGGRRFLHDLVAGTYVITGDENPRTTIYPPQKRWIPIAFTIFAVFCLFLNTNFRHRYEDLEAVFVPSLVGSQSETYLWYLQQKFESTDRNYRVITTDRSRKVLPQIEAMYALQARLHGAQSLKAARYLLFAAMIASRSGDTALTRQYSDMFVALPTSLQLQAMESGDMRVYAWRQTGQNFCNDLLKEAKLVAGGFRAR